MLIRHFATPGNEKRQYIGSTDEVLSEKTAFLKRSYPIPEYIIASPMKRCVQTAKRIWGTDLSGCPIVLEPLMRECDFGQFEGKTYEQLKKNAAYIKWLKSGGITAFPGGEDQEEFRKRCVEGMKKQVRFLIARHVKYAAFVVHGGTIMAVLSSLTGGEYFDFQVKNGEGYETVLEWIQGRWKITSLTKIGCEDSKSEHLQ